MHINGGQAVRRRKMLTRVVVLRCTMDIDVNTFLTTVYYVVDELYQAQYAALKPVRRGAAPQMSDSEVLSVVILAQWQQNRSEAAFLRYARAHWRGYFPRLLTQSAFNRRARDLLGVLCHLGPQVGVGTGHPAG